MSQNKTIETDIIIIGAGPVGLFGLAEFCSGGGAGHVRRFLFLASQSGLARAFGDHGDQRSMGGGLQLAGDEQRLCLLPRPPTTGSSVTAKL